MKSELLVSIFLIFVLNATAKAFLFQGEQVWDCSKQEGICLPVSSVNIARQDLNDVLRQVPNAYINQTLEEIFSQFPSLNQLGFEIYVEYDGTSSTENYSETFRLQGQTRAEIMQLPAVRNIPLGEYITRIMPSEINLQPLSTSVCPRIINKINCSPARLVINLPAVDGFPGILIKSFGVPLSSPVMNSCYYTLPQLSFKGEAGQPLHAEGWIVATCTGEPLELQWMAGGNAGITTSYAMIIFDNGNIEPVKLLLNGQDASQGVIVTSNDKVVLSADMTPARAGAGSGVAWIRLVTP